jgi:hypothetical protein
MQMQQTSCQPSHPIATILAESDLQIAVISNTLLDDPEFDNLLARGLDLDRQIISTRSPDIRGVAMKINLVRKLIEQDDSIGDFVRNLMLSCLLDCHALAG